MSDRLVRATKQGSLFDLRVSTGARRNSIEGMYGEEAIRLKISAPPVDGKANSETERYLAELLGLPRSQVSVVKGASSRDKTVLVRGAEPEEVRSVLVESIRWVRCVGDDPNLIGKIQRVPLREVWRHEALDFTAWLQENIDVVNDALSLSLSSAEREQAAGDFSVDLVAEDELGNPVVVENQLEKSNHDHLGKLLTYLVAIGARTAIWVVSEPRPEHVNAISWLNESSSASFTLLKAEAIRLGDSSPAALLTLVVGPSEESREVGKTKKELAGRYTLRYRFWTELLERSRQKTKLHANISPSRGSWIGTGAGKSGLNYNFNVRQHDAQVELYIDRGKDMEEQNKAIFDTLIASRNDIENDFGGKLDWDSVEGRRGCRIATKITLGGYRDEGSWPNIQNTMIDNMVHLEKALRLHIAKLRA